MPYSEEIGAEGRHAPVWTGPHADPKTRTVQELLQPILPRPPRSIHVPQLTLTVFDERGVLALHGIPEFQKQVIEIVLFLVFGIQLVSPTRSREKNLG